MNVTRHWLAYWDSPTTHDAAPIAVMSESRAEDHADAGYRVEGPFVLEQPQGAVSTAGEAVDLLDELTVYWDVDMLPPHVQDTFGAVRDKLASLRGQ